MNTMLGWITVIAAVSVMVKVADAEGKSSVLWGGITFVLCYCSSMLIPFPFAGVLAGLVLSYGVMLAANMMDEK